MAYQEITIPADGAKIQVDSQGKLQVPPNPIIAFIEGDGIGVDITPVMLRVVNAAVKKAYSNNREIKWMEIYAGEKSVKRYGEDIWLADETLHAIQEFKVAIKGPLTTPVGGGIRSINVTLRQKLDLYVCLRPVRYFPGTPSPVVHPELIDAVIFRENSEDIYAGIEWPADSQEANKVIEFLQREMRVSKIRFPEHCGIGIKPVSKEGSIRLITRAIDYAIEQDREVVTIVHKGNIMKFTEGAFKEWGYELARQKYGAVLHEGGPWLEITNPKTGKKIIINDIIADAFLQQILLRPQDYSVIATLNLNGDYISDALAAQVGGIGIAPGANLSDTIALFEATHGTAPKYAGMNKVNPGSIILSAEMMLRYMGWNEAADLVIQAMEKTILSKQVTYDFARNVPDAKELSCSEFGDALIKNMVR